MVLSKQDLEELVFQKFVKHTGLNLINFQSCKPPEPDILCESQSGKLYFELTDNTPEQAQEAIHTKNERVRNEAYCFNPFPEIYKQKFTKHYETSSLSCELIIYFGIHPVDELGDHFKYRLEKNVEWIRQNIHQSEFQKVWIYDYHKDRVLKWVCVST